MMSVDDQMSIIRSTDISSIFSGASSSGIEVLCRWIDSNSARLAGDLLKQGAVLFRGFKVREPEDFEQVIKAVAKFGYDGSPVESCAMEYIAGQAPRHKVSGQVYTSTSAPAFLRIPLHSEMSYLREYPRRILFFCRQPARIGGETPIADTRRIYEGLPARVRQRFQEKGVIYVRHLASRTQWYEWLSRKLPFMKARTWQGAFFTENWNQVDEFCRLQFTEHAWQDDGSLLVKNHLPAVRKHPATGEKVWFNQAHVMILFSQAHAQVAGCWLIPLLSLYHRIIGGAFTSITYGDGSAISDEDLETVLNAIDQNTFAFRWQHGDVLVLDNLLMAHGRNPFRGRRQVLVGMVS